MSMTAETVKDNQINSAIKVVIWDLDETFWSGTLSEGAVSVLESRKQRVIALNHRGIMNSICSKNDHEQVRKELDKLGLWEQFVFVSAQWAPKGQQVSALLKQMKLRPENTLFVDDNAMNRHEVAFCNPGINIMAPEFWDRVSIEDWGKDDSSLSRLKSYRLLESRNESAAAFAGSNESFLRQSGIRATLTPLSHAAPEIDRLVELINRSNQLNFTKKRFPYGPAQLLFSLKTSGAKAFSLNVVDRYGDYGVCGFASVSKDSVLEHFLFSCRLLDMGIERALYQKLLELFPKLKPPFNGHESLALDASWVSITVGPAPEERASGNSNEAKTKVLTAMGCIGHALEPFLGPEFCVTCSPELLSARIIGDEYKEIFKGEFDFIIIHAYNEALFPVANLGITQLSVPLMLNARVLKEFPKLKKTVESQIYGTEAFDFFGRELVGGTVKIRLFYWLTQLSWVAKQTSVITKSRVEADLCQFLECLPHHVKVVVLKAPADEAVFAEGLWQLLDEKALSHLEAVNQAVESVAESVPNLLPFDIDSLTINLESIGGQFGHYSHKTNWDIGRHLRQFLLQHSVT